MSATVTHPVIWCEWELRKGALIGAHVGEKDRPSYVALSLKLSEAEQLWEELDGAITEYKNRYDT